MKILKLKIQFALELLYFKKKYVGGRLEQPCLYRIDTATNLYVGMRE